ncbi:TetR/AcrR family transcriptional regulator [Lentilactobacillus sp. Marseille-Q4993]|uniref:TetR/AcrR family transcriptional regulator n=1 Tax=Lentilactobacillus sp. Marseille-Q4993 TaxID=3039492 RepID=UPI0024BC2BB4|nr:TetR/AcrR family transcriptional regulator [Lentilactobacillus sp. Marseille-Q4993]
MPSTTFENLNPDKQQLIEDALLKEFSEHPLEQSQVARIIKSAGIARGAFYKYFEDLTDAYGFIFKKAMINFHKDIPDYKTTDPEEYANSVERFVANVTNSQYYNLLKLHYQYNEMVYSDEKMIKSQSTMPPKIWSIAILSHQAIKEALTYPEDTAAIVAKLRQSLSAFK